MAEHDIAVWQKQLGRDFGAALAETGAQLRRRFLSVLTNEKSRQFSATVAPLHAREISECES